MNRVTAYTTTDPFPRGAGYFYFLGILQIATGILSVLFSAFGFLQVGLAESWGLYHPLEVGSQLTGRGTEGWANLVAGYLSFHLAFGWIFGALMIAAGLFSIQRRRRPVIWLSTVVNLLNFPHGTTTALLTWHGLKRPDIAEGIDHQGH